VSVRIATVAAATLAVAATPAQAAQAAPKVSQLVVFRNGSAVQKQVTASQVSVKVGKKHCTLGAGTPLAALVRSHIGAVQLHDYGSCSSHPQDAASLYVRRIRKDAAKGLNGWVYKVGNKAASAGAGDPAGRLKSGARVTWFFCRMGANGCQRTLGVTATARGAGQVSVTVRAYDDRGKSRAGAGATVHVGSITAKADAHGKATVTVSPGTRKVYAQSKGLVRSYAERIDVT
jgi:hypothetical protein